jgi:hypothetical protein
VIILGQRSKGREEESLSCTWGKNILGREKSKCKGPKVGACLRNSKGNNAGEQRD